MDIIKRVGNITTYEMEIEPSGWKSDEAHILALQEKNLLTLQPCSG